MQPIELSRYRHSKANPFAPPDRRYRLARTCLAEGIKPSFCHDDKETWDLLRYLRKREAASEPDQRIRLQITHPDLSAAFQLHHGKLRNLRPLSEAYILAGADDDSIAEKMAIPKDAIGWFRVAFYDVEHLRDSPLFIVHKLIGITDEDGQSVLDTHRLWKLIGYQLGPGALDKLFHDTKGDEEAFKAGGLGAWFSRHAQTALQSKLRMAIDNMNANDPKFAGLLLKWLLEDRRDQAQKEATSLNALEHHINAMLAELPWCHGTAAREAFQDTELGPFDECAAELRDDELQLVAAGEAGPKFEEIQCLNIGPPRPKGKPGKSPGK